MRKPTKAEIDDLVDCWCEDEWPVTGDADERRSATEHNTWVKQDEKSLLLSFVPTQHVSGNRWHVTAVAVQTSTQKNTTLS